MLLVGCSPAADEAAGDAAALQRTAVVDDAIAALERELGPGQEAAPYPGDDLEERVHGLVASIASSNESMRRVVLEELEQLGDHAVPLLEGVLENREAPAEERGGAAQALAAIDTPAAAEVLLARVESSRIAEQPELWLIAQCAWRLGETTQDQVVPRLLLCLRYEKDHETVLWLANTLAHFGNRAGLEAVYVVATTGADELRERAAGLLSGLGEKAGARDWSELLYAWQGEPGTTFEETPPSTRHELEIWRHIRALSEWQLRGVDDGRFLLSREGPTAARFLAAALGDPDRYIRVHSAQCLARMGPRGAVAGPAVVAALDDPDVAHEAAAAIGGLRYAAGAPALIERLSEAHPLELRVAAARALGALTSSEATDALLPLLADDVSLDLRAAAAGTLARSAPLERAAPAVRTLVELLPSPALEPTETEAALEAWLTRMADTEVEGARRVYEGWRALHRGRPAERIELRATLLRDHLDSLLN
jgi:HEAT repeat protein